MSSFLQAGHPPLILASASKSRASILEAGHPSIEHIRARGQLKGSPGILFNDHDREPRLVKSDHKLQQVRGNLRGQPEGRFVE